MTREEIRKRDERSQLLQVYQINDSDYFVESSKGMISYKVQFSNGHKSCACGDYTANIKSDPGFSCKHILAVINGNSKKLECLKHKPKLDDRWITSIKGKDFVVYSGLLDLAHQIGLKSIEVEVIQYPDKDNGNEAICMATTYSNDGRMFVDYGDANPKNSSSMVVNHLIRVASTRAKARTLRDMTNIGMTCLEELGGDDELTAVTPVKVKKDSAKTQSTRVKAKSTDKARQAEPETQSSPDNGKPSSAQVNAIKNLAYRRGLSDNDINKLAQDKLKIPSFQDLSADQAGRFIKILQQAA